jgi:TrmH family RNA methyltransferase
MDRPRAQLAGPDEIEPALVRGEPVRLLLASPCPRDPRVAALVERARRAGIAVHAASEASLRRLSKTDPPAEILALVGPDPRASAEQALAAGGAAWLLVGVAYPGNTGFAIRTAEVSGADAVFVDNDFDHEARREATRAAMRADRLLPVLWMDAPEVVRLARAAGRRVLALEDVGDAAPWEVDLTGPVLFVVGGERHGIPADLLASADRVLRIPMRGFIPSYNLQAAMAGAALERLRQTFRKGSGIGL